MKIADVVDQLAKIIPQETDFFSDTIAISTISSDGSLVSVLTSAVHGLSTGNFINVRNVKTENSISSISFSTVDGVSTLEIVTTLSHDLTLNPRETETQLVELLGFTDSSWNESLELTKVSSRKVFTIVNGTASEPTLSGNEVLLETVLGKFNGPQTVTVIDTLNFTYVSDFTATGQSGDIQSNIRIAGIVNFERALEQYTTQLVDEFFMFVVAPTSVTANKSRGSQTDINDEQTQQSNFNGNIRDGFIILVIATVSSEAGSLASMDNIRDEVFRAILLSVRGFTVPSGLQCEPNQVSNFISHGTLLYDTARYVHQFIFEQPLVMTISDSVQAETRAFRDISFTNAHPDNADAPELTSDVDLDDTPDELIFTGTLNGALGGFEGAINGVVEVLGALIGALGGFAGTINGTSVEFTGTLNGALGGFEATINGTSVEFTGTLNGALGGFEATINGTSIGFIGTLNGALGGFEGAINGTSVGFIGTLNGALGGFEATINGTSVGFIGTLNGALGGFEGTINGAVEVEGTLNGALGGFGGSIVAIMGFDLSKVTYTGNSFSVSSEENQPAQVAWNTDGTKFFVVGVTNNTVFEYTVSVGFDLSSTVAYSGNSFSVVAQDTVSTGLAWNNDGTKFFVVGQTTDTLYEYTVSVGFDLSSTVAYSGNSFSVAGQDTGPTDIIFNNDGTKFFIIGDINNTVYEYTVSVAFDLSSTVAYSGNSFSVNSEDTSPRSIAFNNDGTKFFMIGLTTDAVYEYTISTAFDFSSTVTYTGRSASVASEEVTPTGLAWNTGGTKFFIVGLTTDTVYEYILT